MERLGYSREELLSTKLHDFDAGLPDEDTATLIDEMPEDEMQVIETVHETKSGEEIPVEISSNLISYRGRTAILSVGRDIPERKQHEKQLEEFASVVSHDLRNPLNVAEGHLELAETDCDRDHLDVVDRAHEWMHTLIEDLLTLATVETADATLRIDTDLWLRTDRSRLKQLLENLIRNAVEHGGEDVTVTIGDLDGGFYVAGDGPEIPADEREPVFDVGYSTTTEGTGFGLVIAKQIAEAHGWEISLSEAENGGTRFEITGIRSSE